MKKIREWINYHHRQAAKKKLYRKYGIKTVRGMNHSDWLDAAIYQYIKSAFDTDITYADTDSIYTGDKHENR